MQACSADPRYSMPIAYEMQAQLQILEVCSVSGCQKLCQYSHDRSWATGSGQVGAAQSERLVQAA